MYRVHLEADARQELTRRAHQPEIAPNTRDRLEMLRLSDAGGSIPKIARHLAYHEQTVRHWIKTFLLEGFDALVDVPRPGKPSAIPEEIRQDVRAWIEKGDRIWSAGQIAAEVERVHGLRLSSFARKCTTRFRPRCSTDFRPECASRTGTSAAEFMGLAGAAPTSNRNGSPPFRTPTVQSVVCSNWLSSSSIASSRS